MFANVLTIAAAGVTLTVALIHSLPLGVIGLCATGFSYGTGPTISSAFTSAFYGSKHIALNFSVMNFNLMGVSFVVTASSAILETTGGYTVPFLILLVPAIVFFALDLSIRRL